MSRGFGTTFGVGTTDAVTTSFNSNAIEPRSYWAWCYVNVVPSVAPRVFDATAGSTVGSEMFLTVGGAPTFENFFSGNTGTWSTSSVTWTAGTLHSWGVAYDNGSASNDPTFYIDNSKLTVSGGGLTESTTPSGTQLTTADNYVIGNRAAANRNWDGWIAHFAIWRAILTDAEFKLLAWGALPSIIRPASLIHYSPLSAWPEIGTFANGLRGTLTGTKLQPDPPFIRRLPLLQPKAVAVVVVAAKPKMVFVNQAVERATRW